MIGMTETTSQRGMEVITSVDSCGSLQASGRPGKSFLCCPFSTAAACCLRKETVAGAAGSSLYTDCWCLSNDVKHLKATQEEGACHAGGTK